MASIHNMPLEGDGIIENLYTYLWTKDELDEGPRLNIPDTIVYKYRQPAAWYFTSIDGSIKRKNKSNLINVRIEEAFLKKSFGSDIVAYYISSNQAEHEEDRVTTIEYFTEDTFREFLYQRTKVNNGILQRFIEPKGVNNSMTRVIWSPKVCMLERRCNKLKLHDTKLDLYQRAVTYDGEEFNSVTVPVRGSRLPAEVQRMCENVVSHVAEVSFQKYKISRMVLNMKIDPTGKMWLLWASSLRCDGIAHGRDRGDSAPDASTRLALPSRHAHLIKPPSKKGPLNIGATVTVPKKVRLSNLLSPDTWAQEGCDGEITRKSPTKREQPQTGKRGKRSTRIDDEEMEEDVDPLLETCPSCGNYADGSHMHHVLYKTIVDHYEQLMLLLGLKPLKQRPQSEAGRSVGGAGAGAGGDEEPDRRTPASIPRESVWPPKPLVQSAAGGVGLFGLYPEPLTQAQRASGTHKAPKPPTVSAIPPMLSKAHPKLVVDDYKRFRKDPLFLYKSLTVCEDCFLVYAEVASNVMQGMEPGSAVFRVMGTRASEAARRRQVPKPVQEGARYSRVRARERAEAAQRDALAGEMAELPSRRSSNGSGSKRFYPETLSRPAMPRPVAVEEAQGLSSTLRSSLMSSELPDDVGADLAHREYAFYNQLSMNPNLHKSHPLLHMLGQSQGQPGATSGSGVPGTAPERATRGPAGSASTPVLPLRPFTGPAHNSLADGLLLSPSRTGQFSTLPNVNKFSTWGASSSGGGGGASAAMRKEVSRVEARGGATLKAYNSAPADDRELRGRSGPVRIKNKTKHRSARGSTTGSMAGKRSPIRASSRTGGAGGAGGSSSKRSSKGKKASKHDFNASAAKHQEFLNQMATDVKQRLEGGESLARLTQVDPTVKYDKLGTKDSPKRSKSKKKLTNQPSWRDIKQQREAEKAANEAKEAEAEEAARKERMQAYKERLKQRESERALKLQEEEDDAEARRQRAAEERQARAEYAARAKAGGAGSTLGGQSHVDKPQPPAEVQDKQGTVSYEALYKAAEADAEAEIAALQAADTEAAPQN